MYHYQMDMYEFHILIIIIQNNYVLGKIYKVLVSVL